MGLLDTLLGRTKPVPANLDALFALPSAAITLQSAAGIAASGRAGVCYKPPTGQGFADMQAEVLTLLGMDGGRRPRAPNRTATATTGWWWRTPTSRPWSPRSTWSTRRCPTPAGAPQLLCSVFGLAPVPDDAGGRRPARPGSTAPPSPGSGSVVPSTAFLVYLFKRGTFYPFVPDGPEHRDNAAELRLQSLVAGDLAVEPELDRWFPLWDLPLG